jgi:hypothetical protein
MFIKRFRAFALALLFATSATYVLHAQQNLFNIPSGDITPTGEWFYQHQLNFYEVDDLETKSHFVYGIADGWDIGIKYKLSPQFLLMGDFISGDHKKSQTVLGGGVNVNNYLQVFVGKLFDFPNGDLDSGIVLEINLYGWDFKRASSH